MRRLLIALLILCCSTFAHAGVVIGQFSTASGGPIVNGNLTFVLSQSAIEPGFSSVVPQSVSCYTSSTGQIVGVPDPLSLPTVAANIVTGTLSAGTYYVRFSYVGAGGESAASPERAIILSSQGSLIVSAPTIQPGNASGFNVYIGASGAEKLVGSVSGWNQFTQSTPLPPPGAAFPTANSSSCGLAFSDQLIPTGTFYTVSMTSARGTRVAGFPQTWCSFGGAGGTINVSQGIPSGTCSNSGVYYPTPILATPLSGAGATQSINGGLNLSGYALSGVSGFDNLMIADFAPGNDIGAKVMALAASSTTIYVTSSSTQTTPISLSTSNTQLVCLNGATLTKGANIDQITVTGANVRITGCTLEGAKASFTGNGIVVSGADKTTLDHNFVENQTGYAYLLDAATNFDVHNNYGLNGKTVPAFVTASAAGAAAGPGRITANYFDSSTALGADQHAITMTPTGTGAHVDDITLTGNTLVAGSGYCAEARTAPTASGVSDIILTGNYCARTAAGDGGYSFSGVSGGSASGGTIDLNGMAATFNVEIANSSGISITGLTIKGGGTALGAIDLNSGSHDNTITGNTMTGIAGPAIHLYAGSGGQHSDDNIISGNRISLAGAAQGYCVWLQSNNATASVSRTIVSENNCTGNGVATSQGIRVENNAGVLDSTQIIGNTISNLGQGIGLAGETATVYSLNHFTSTVTTPIVGTPGAGSGPIIGQGTGVQVSNGVTQGSGFKHQRWVGVLGGTCPTAGAIGAACTSAAKAWTTAFADANYTVTCSIVGGITNQPHIVQIASVANTGITVTIAADTAAAADVAAAGMLDCIAVHD